MHKIRRHFFGVSLVALAMSLLAAYHFYQYPNYSICGPDCDVGALCNCAITYTYSKWLYVFLAIAAVSLVSLVISFKKSRKDILSSIKNGKTRRNLKFIVLLLLLQLSVGYLALVLMIAARTDCGFDGTIVNYQCGGGNVFLVPGFLYFILPPVLAKLLADWRKWNLSWLRAVLMHVLTIFLSILAVFIFIRLTFHPWNDDPMFYGCADPYQDMIIQCGIDDTAK